ncbi:MAG: hypothetical protein KJP12_03160 [Acidimicrobiia bacterium]|nr:hypothetical protein [Acidimicrobiia bacterium]
MSLVVASMVAVLLFGAPGDALELTPGPPPPPPPASVAPASPAPSPGGHRPESGGLDLGLLLGVAAGLRVGRRRPEDEVVSDPVVVFVTGHGNEPGDFDALRAQMGLAAEDVVVFDWRAAVLDADHAAASERSSVAEAAGDLHAFLQGAATSGRPIYLVGFSKGAASIAELLSWWDQDESMRIANVYGASLLDPPIADGVTGWMQRVGFWVGPIPDNGGFDPHRCDGLGCRDVRAHLGEPSGVDVLVIRNPDAWVTSFRDRPPGLRIYDLSDDGGGHVLDELLGPVDVSRPWILDVPMRIWRSVERVAEAHNSVLEHPEVAECLAAEIRRPGDCDETWDAGHRWPMQYGWISGGGGTPRL